MMVVSGRTQRFSAASPVTRYWLAHCVGFSVVGGGRGTVERVLADDNPHVAAQLEIRRGRKRRRIPVSAVLEVVPAEQVLVVRRSERATARREALGRTGTVLGDVLFALASGLVRAGEEIVRLVRSLPWRQSGHSVRSGTTRLWREISTTWSLLHTTSSDPRNAKRSSDRARTTSST
jgi:hypothetical protein